MNAETLRKAAALMRERAKAASPSDWQYSTVHSVGGGALYDETRAIANVVYEQPRDHDGSIIRHLLVPEADANGVHIASWHPAVALAVADGLDDVAGRWAHVPRRHALAVARAYLGEAQ